MDIKRFKNSFGYALSGIRAYLKDEQNIKVHFLAGVLVIGAGFFFKISKLEFAILILTISSVIVAELINTAIECVVDLVTEDRHPLAKAAKDIAAGAVLVCALGSVLIGLIIFSGPIMNLIR